MGIIESNTHEKRKSNIEFFDYPFEIPEQMKITLWRFNSGNKSPYGNDGVPTTCWNYSAKSVIDLNGGGIFGVQEESAKLHHSILDRDALLMPDTIFMKIEADKRDIVSINKKEVAVSRCNIVEVLSKEEYLARNPALLTAVYCSKGDIITLLSLLEELKMFIRLNYFFDVKLHGGFTHQKRVEENILILSEYMGISEEEITPFLDFAYWHDTIRLNYGYDPEHGKRAAETLRKNRDHFNLQNISDEDVDRLCFACEHHTNMHKSGDLLVDICFDADRLDLSRVGVQPDPQFMATEAGIYFAKNYEEFEQLKNKKIKQNYEYYRRNKPF